MKIDSYVRNTTKITEQMKHNILGRASVIHLNNSSSSKHPSDSLLLPLALLWSLGVSFGFSPATPVWLLALNSRAVIYWQACINTPPSLALWLLSLRDGVLESALQEKTRRLYFRQQSVDLPLCVTEVSWCSHDPFEGCKDFRLCVRIFGGYFQVCLWLLFKISPPVCRYGFIGILGIQQV